MAKVSIVIPTRNSSSFIRATIHSVQIQEHTTSEIIIVDDCCPQKSGKIALSISKKIKKIKVLFHKKNKGYGAALKTGLKNSKNEWIFMIDGDNEYDVNEIFKLMKESENNDLIITYRYKKKYNN